MHSVGKCISIGVFGLHASVGTTWLSVSIAAYFGDVRGKNTAAAEYGLSKDAFSALAAEQGAEIRKCGFFNCAGADFYPMMTAETLAGLKNGSYEACVIDLGHKFEKVRDILYNCDIKVLVGSAAPWRARDFYLIDKISREVISFNSWRFMLGCGNKKMLGKLHGLPMKAGFMECEANPLCPSDKSIRMLHKMLS